MEWKGQQDDITCEIGRFTLRIEQLDNGTWWWAVYFAPDENRASGFVETKQEAIDECECMIREIAHIVIVKNKLA